MIKIGIRAHDMGKMDAKTLFDKAKTYGFDGIQLVVNKAIDQTFELTEDNFKSLKSVQGVDVMLLGSYFNPVHSNKLKVEEGIQRFNKQLELAKILDCQYVASETGSYNDDQWTLHPNNHTKTAYDQVKVVFEQLVKQAESVDRTVLVEAAYGHVIFSPLVLKTFVADLNSKHVGVIVDLYNLLNFRTYKQYMTILEDALRYLKPCIKVFHLKNFIVENDKLIQTGLQNGLMDYRKLLPMMIKSNPDAYFIFEGITGEDILKSLDYIKAIIKEEL